MKKQLLLKTFLMAVCLLVGASNAWADTTIGATNKGWAVEGSYKSYLVSTNQTLTLTFTVTDYSGDWAGYVFNLTKTNAISFGGDNGYVWFRSPDFAWFKTAWNTGAVVSNTNTKGDMSQSDWQAFVKDATTVMDIQRFGTQVFIKTTVTKDATSYSHYFVQEIGTAKDVYAFLCADNAVINISSDVTTDTETVESTTATIGSSFNDGGFVASPVTTLAPESVLNMHFTNHSAKGETYQNYGLELVYNGNYANIVIGGGRWGSLLVDEEGDPVTTPVTNKEETFNDFGDDFKNKMDGADVSLTIARSGRVVIITAVHTPSDAGTPFVLKYTLEPNATAFPNFATEDIQVNLTTDHSHITYNFPISEVNAEISSLGWSTFSSVYALDFKNATPSGLTAYMVTGTSGTDKESTITPEAVDNVPGSTGLLLNGAEGTFFYTIPVLASSSTNTENNLMKAAVTATTVSYSDNNGYNYVLAENNGTPEFKHIVSGEHPSANIAAGKAYLALSAPSAPTLSLNFNNTTGIGATLMNNERVNSEIYNLAGQRVAKPTKGLYIVNGRKVVMK